MSCRDILPCAHSEALLIDLFGQTRHPTGVPARVVPKSMAMAYQKIGGPHAFR